MNSSTFTPLRLVERIERRSFLTDDIHELKRRLEAAGGQAIPAPTKQAWRVAYRGGFAMAYQSGSVVLGGASPEPLYKVLKRLCTPDDPPWQPAPGGRPAPHNQQDDLFAIFAEQS